MQIGSVVPISNDTAWDNQSPVSANNVTISGGTQNFCSSCSTSYYGAFHTCGHYHDTSIAELSAWIDGYTQDRPLTAKRLTVIRKKLREFCEG